METLLHLPKLNVIDERGSTEYSCSFDSNHIPNYFPMDMSIHPSKASEDSTECFFLNIKHKTFLRDRKNKFYGLRYLYSIGDKSVSVHVANDLIEFESMSTKQLIIKIQRFLYHIEGENNIHIERYCDTLHPPMIFTINGTEEQILAALKETLNDSISSLNMWYLDRKI